MMLKVDNAMIMMGGRRLFSDLSFEVDRGKLLCIMGDSASGKTTLLKALMGFLPLDEGSVAIDGTALAPATAYVMRRRMAYLPQELALPSEWVSEMVRLPFTLKANADKTFSREKLMKEWAMLDLDVSLYDKKVAELSGGQRQRIMLSVCGLLGKDIILADEPTSALDPRTSALVLDYLRLLASRGAAVIVVSHDKIIKEGATQCLDLESYKQ